MSDNNGWVSSSGLSEAGADASREALAPKEPLATVVLHVHGPSSKDVELRWSFASASNTESQRASLISAALAALAESAGLMKKR